MPVPRITTAQFEKLLQNGILQRDATADVTTGPIRNVIVTPSSRVFEGQNTRVRGLYQLLSLQGVDDLLPEDIDAFVFNEQVIRSTGTPAFVTLTFSRTAKPTFDISIATNFPVGTETDPDTGVQTTFVTLQTATLLAANAGAYFNPQTAKYELSVVAASLTVGPATRVGRNRVSKPLRPLIGFDSVTNKAESTGGLAAETNAEVTDRYFLRVLGTEIGTPAGLARYVRQAFGNVQDTFIVYGNDPFLTRADSDAGAVDIWILGASPVERTMVVPYPGSLVQIPFDRQPGISVTSVVSGGTFTEGTDYVLSLDTGIYGRSTRGNDGIQFLPTGVQPPLGDPVSITYTFDNLIVALQAFFETPEYKETGRDGLFRRGEEVQIGVAGNLTINAGDPSAVLAQVQQAFLDTLNGTTTQRGYRLGQDVEQFDLDAVLSRIPGVDNFVYTLLAVAGGSGVADIPIGRNEYARLSSANLSITLT